MYGIFHSDHPAGSEKVLTFEVLCTVDFGTRDALREQVRHTHALEEINVLLKSLGGNRDIEST